ncbi:MAG: methionyl-tRNA formyltransferase [Gammaproteobacteria bacterium]|nr:methionyl-tRNA formyltransferase [Gammaproteobacteria bacterium]
MGWRLAFAGAPHFAATILQRLLESEHEVGLVYTQPERPKGRGRKVAPSPVQVLAESARTEVRTPTRLLGEEETLASFDYLVVAAYGLLLPDAILDAPRHGCLNVHASLLPRWRGAAPVERAIMAGDAETGVSIMRIAARLDAGPVYRQRLLPLTLSATGASVTDDLASLGAETLLEVLAELPGLAARPQEDVGATYAHKLTSADSVVDWLNDAAFVDRQVRALSGRAAAYTTAADDVRMRILEAIPEAAVDDSPPGTLRQHSHGWQVTCRRGALGLLSVQLNRGRGTPMPIQSAVNGYGQILFDGAQLGANNA